MTTGRISEKNIWVDDKLIVINHKNKTIDIPQSLSPKDYPDLVKELVNSERYFKQLTIE